MIATSGARRSPLRGNGPWNSLGKWESDRFSSSPRPASVVGTCRELKHMVLRPALSFWSRTRGLTISVVGGPATPIALTGPWPSTPPPQEPRRGHDRKPDRGRDAERRREAPGSPETDPAHEHEDQRRGEAQDHGADEGGGIPMIPVARREHDPHGERSGQGHPR